MIVQLAEDKEVSLAPNHQFVSFVKEGGSYIK